MKETDLAWIAGFFDGEGYCGLTQISRIVMNQSYNSFVVIANTNRDILMTIYRTVGLGELIDTHKATLTHKRQYKLNFIPSQQVKFLRMILPYLKLKLRQAELLIEFHEACKATKDGFKSVLTDAQVLRRAEIFDELKALNAKGPQ